MKISDIVAIGSFKLFEGFLILRILELY